MSPPKQMGVDLGADEQETPLRRVRGSIDMLANRVGGTESQLQQLNLRLAALESVFAEGKALIRGAASRVILLVLGAVGGTYGFTRATAPAPSVEHTTIQKSATTVKVEACTAMQPGPDRDQCAIRILTELMGQQR